MRFGEVIEILKSEGFADTPDEERKLRHRVRYAIIHEHVPRPKLASNGDMDFRENHLLAIRRYVENPPKRGRRPVRHRETVSST